jgi:hypothetical protein
MNVKIPGKIVDGYQFLPPLLHELLKKEISDGGKGKGSEAMNTFTIDGKSSLTPFIQFIHLFGIN